MQCEVNGSADRLSAWISTSVYILSLMLVFSRWFVLKVGPQSWITQICIMKLSSIFY